MKRIPEPELMDIPARAEAYARADFNDVNAAFVERLEELTADRTIRRVLDLGTGPGDIAFRLAGRHTNWNISAVDGSAPMLDLARGDSRYSATRGNLNFLRTDALRLPFTDRSFDVVCSNSILHHVNGADLLWRETKRVTAIDGIIFVRDLFRPDSTEEANRIVETYAKDEARFLKDDFYNSLLAAYSIEEIKSQLKRAGLRNLSVERITDRHVDVYGRV